jgi:WD40 repeat protein
VKITDIATGRELHSFKPEAGHSIPSVEFNAKGTHVVASGDSHLVAINISTGEKTIVAENIGWVAKYRFSPDGRFMATASMSGIIVWDARSWKELVRFGGDVTGGDRGYLAFSRDSRYVAAIDHEGHLRFWDPATGADVCTVGEGLKAVGPVVFTSDGRVMAQGGNGTVRVFGPKRSLASKPTDGGK